MKKGKDSSGRIAGLELRCEWMFEEVVFGALLV
jgi:hypothetical protein